MSELNSLDPLHDPAKAKEHLAQGKDNKSKGYFDIALTDFRRAVVADPQLVDAWVEIGNLCKTKANSDKMFLRYAFEAFQKAARLDPKNQNIHDQYITMAQHVGQLEDINEEYRNLLKQHPDDALFQRCYKNTTTLLLAKMPDKVDIGGLESAKKIRTLLMIISLALIFMGFGSTFIPVMLNKTLHLKLSASVISQIFRIGIGMILTGVAGIIIRSRIS